MTSYTARLKLPIPDFLTEPWEEEFAASMRAIDTAIANALLAIDVTTWANSTAYAIGDIVISPQDGSLWICAVAHTSVASPTTFSATRTANPTFWNASATIPAQRGTWTTATSYIVGDFVIDVGRYAVCLIAHTSGVFNTDLAAGKWSILIDTSTFRRKYATVRAASTTNVTLASGLEAGDTAGGVVLVAGNRFGAFGQTDPTANGIFVVQTSGPVVRSEDFNTFSDHAGAMIYVEEGTLADVFFRGTSDAVGILDVTAIVFARFDATDAETVTGTSTTKFTTPANLTAKMAAPGVIGGTTPAAAAFTELVASSGLSATTGIFTSTLGVTALSTLGAATLSGLLTVNGQIAFPATANPSANVNTLDDYEEGTFTPSLTFSSSGSATYTGQIGLYTKIGRAVFVQAYITFDKNTGAGNMAMAGLPFAAANVSAFNQTLGLQFSVGLIKVGVSVWAILTPNSQAVLLYTTNDTTGAGAQMAAGNFAAGTVDIGVGGMYTT